MNKSWFYLGAIGSLAALITSCGESPKPPAPAATPAPAAAAPPAVAPTVPATPIAAATPTPKASGKSTVIKPVSVDVAAGLIAPTDGDNWAKTVSKGRADPFAMLALQPIEVAEIKDPFNPTATPVAKSQIASNPSPQQTVTNNSLPTKVSGKQRIASNGNKTVATGASARSGIGSISAIPRTGINRALPKIIVAISAAKSVKSTTTAESRNNTKPVKAAMVPKSRNNNSIPATKPVQASGVVAFKPEKVAEKPLQAIALEISGVIEVAGTTQVIVKLPTESFSRYIEVGDRVADGKVLIKRVEGQNSLSPTVVLEEVGVEVPRKIGDKSPAPEAPVAAPPLRTP